MKLNKNAVTLQGIGSVFALRNMVGYHSFTADLADYADWRPIPSAKSVQFAVNILVLSEGAASWMQNYFQAMV